MKPDTEIELSTPSDLEIRSVRKFTASREMLFDAHTKPELIKKWLLGPPGATLPVCEINLRVGGKLRYVWLMADGSEMGLSGIYKEIVRPERIVHTELFDEDWTGGETLVTTEFFEEDGVTKLVMTVRYSSTEARDDVMQSGAFEGLGMTYDSLEKFVES